MTRSPRFEQKLGFCAVARPSYLLCPLRATRQKLLPLTGRGDIYHHSRTVLRGSADIFVRVGRGLLADCGHAPRIRPRLRCSRKSLQLRMALPTRLPRGATSIAFGQHVDIPPQVCSRTLAVFAYLR